MVTPATKVAPILKSIHVRRGVEDAFRIFTAETGTWWPVDRYSIGGEERISGVVFEQAEGGRIYEVWDDGTQCDWATLLAWEPPHRFVMAWQPNKDRPAPTEVEVRFVAEADGTRVELEHRAWERLGEQGAAAREGYAGGWDHTLDRYAKAAS